MRAKSKAAVRAPPRAVVRDASSAASPRQLRAVHKWGSIHTVKEPEIKSHVRISSYSARAFPRDKSKLIGQRALLKRTHLQVFCVSSVSFVWLRLYRTVIYRID